MAALLLLAAARVTGYPVNDTDKVTRPLVRDNTFGVAERPQVAEQDFHFS